MAIAIPVLVLLAAAFAVPNYLAIRYAMFGGSGPVSVSAGATGAAGGKGQVAALPRTRGLRVPAFVQRGYMWKALSPIVFAVSFILGIAVGGAAGIGIAVFGFLNLLWGMVGWSGHMAGKRHY